MRKRSHKIAISRTERDVEPISPVDLPQPWEQTAVFEREAPLELEIGSGRGLFITNAALQKPEYNFLGIEISKKFAKHCAGLIEENDLKNAAMICGDAFLVLKDLLPDNSLHAVHIYFPDPWWKRKHRKRRIVCETVIRLVHQKLIPGGHLHFWTDVEEYYYAGLKSIANVSGFDGPLEIDEKEARHDFDYHTHFERRTRLNGLPVFRSLWVRRSPKK